MPRLRFFDFRMSRAPRVLGVCADNMRELANFVNTAQRRLFFAQEAGDEGWWGSWAEVQFNHISRTTPFITCPRHIARLQKLNVCQRPVWIKNQFYEYLDFGNGRLPKRCPSVGWCDCNSLALTRNNVVTFANTTITPFYVRIYAVDSADNGAAKRVLVQGLDDSDKVVYTQDIEQLVAGEYVTLTAPFTQTDLKFSRITGIQKDPTVGDIQIFQVDTTTGDERLISVMEPGETVAGYRRYYLNGLPNNCCRTGTSVEDLSVTAIAKLEPIPVVYDTDYLVLQNIEALIEESIAVRMSEMDNVEAQRIALVHHKNAVKLLNSEITHYLGKQSPAVSFSPFGTASLERKQIGIQV